MALMTEALERINTYCHLTGSGRSREDVEKQLSFFPFRLADEVYEYYQWTGAPTGDRFPEGWDGSYNNNSTYQFTPGYYLRLPSDVIHFLSLEEAEKIYPNYSNNADIYDPKCLPFVSYEYGELVIVGSETPIEVSPVLKKEDLEYELWFPSLTNLMLAIAESLETLRSIYPPSIPPDEDGDTYLDPAEEKERWKTLAAITKKYGSSRGVIVTN